MTQRTVLVHARGSMLPDECAFWDAVSDACQTRGATLRLMTHNIVKGSMRTPSVQVPNGLDAIAPVDRCCDVPGWVDADSLLARESLWRGVPRDVQHEAQRVRALGVYARLCEAALRACQPSVCVIWNGHHPQEMILRAACERVEVPTLWLERGPIPGTLQLDEVGVLGGSLVAVCPSIGTAQATWHSIAEQISLSQLASAWEQPRRVGADALRAQLGITPSDAVVFFAGQVDADVQGFLYGNGCSNTQAFARFVESLPKREHVFVLGKHHPRSNTSLDEYREALSGRRGVWVEDVSIADCLAVADRVAAVNSTVLFEALCLGKPVLSMGMSLLSNKGIAYQFGIDTIEDWLDRTDVEQRRSRWRAYLAHLLEHHLFAMKPEEEASPMHGAERFAQRILASAMESPSAMRCDEEHRRVLREWTGFGAITGNAQSWPELQGTVSIPDREAYRV